MPSSSIVIINSNFVIEMSGILHILFGLIMGVVFLKMSGNTREKRGWTLGLFFVFVINNYIGPDFRGFVKRVLAIPLQSETLFLFSEAIHSYVGWILWALLWAPLWYGVLLLMEKERAKHLLPAEEAIPDKQNLSYFHVFLAVLIGGIFHLFIDTIGHVEDVGGIYEFLGQIGLVTPFGPDVILCYVIPAAAILGGLMLWHTRSKKLPKIGLRITLKSYFLSHQTLKIGVLVGIALGNAFLLYGAMAAGNLVTVVIDTFPWNGMPYEVIAFDLANVLIATKDFIAGSGTWYTVIIICAFIVIFVIAYSRRFTIKVRGRQIHAEYVIITIVIIAIITGYLLQPVLGNISNHEADFGAFVFLWAFLGFPLVAAALVRKKSEETRSEKLD